LSAMNKWVSLHFMNIDTYIYFIKRKTLFNVIIENEAIRSIDLWSSIVICTLPTEQSRYVNRNGEKVSEKGRRNIINSLLTEMLALLSLVFPGKKTIHDPTEPNLILFQWSWNIWANFRDEIPNRWIESKWKRIFGNCSRHVWRLSIYFSNVQRNPDPSISRCKMLFRPRWWQMIVSENWLKSVNSHSLHI